MSRLGKFIDKVPVLCLLTLDMYAKIILRYVCLLDYVKIVLLSLYSIHLYQKYADFQCCIFCINNICWFTVLYFPHLYPLGSDVTQTTRYKSKKGYHLFFDCLFFLFGGGEFQSIIIIISFHIARRSHYMCIEV